VTESHHPLEARRGERAVVLLSGGLDSTTVLAIAAREAGQRVHALSFAYGQRHVVELACAKRQAQRFGVVAHEIVELAALGQLVRHATSLVAGSELEVPSAEARAGRRDIPSTYVPARNTLFLSYALAWAEVLGARDIWLGINAVDYSGYPDCRPEFIAAFERLAAVATKAGVEADDSHKLQIHAPLIDLHKHEIIARGLSLGVDYADTTSCYDPREHEGVALACGRCESCSLRREGFVRASTKDPTRYV
jgi:7-cyano-7-deazaguanine synthase